MRSSFFLRVPACKKSDKFFRGKGRKFDFAHIPMVDRLGCDKNYWIVFFGKLSFYFKEICKLPNSVKIVIRRTILLNKFESLACKTTSLFRL